MKKTTKWGIWITALLPLLVAALAWSRLPDTIPIHWGLNGQPNGWAGRSMIFLLGSIGLIITIILMVAERIDPKRENIEKRQGIYEILMILMNLMTLALVGMTVTEALHPGTLDVGKVVTLIVGVLFAVLGNYIPKVKQNYTFGMRTSWALADENNWRYTNRIGGILLFAAGILLIIASFLLSSAWLMVLVLGVVIVFTAGTYLASYLYYRAHK